MQLSDKRQKIGSMSIYDIKARCDLVKSKVKEKKLLSASERRKLTLTLGVAEAAKSANVTYATHPASKEEIAKARKHRIDTFEDVSNVLPKPKKQKTWSQSFLDSKEWKELRAKVFSERENICVRCGSLSQLQLDHIKPKSKFKEIALDESNLQILCWPCNRKKAARIE